MKAPKVKPLKLSEPFLIEIDKIKPNPDNPRVIKDDKWKKLVKSLKDFPDMMSLRPVVINKKNVIIGGNMRYQAAKEIGWTNVPAIRAELTPSQEKQFIIKDNLSYGEWDWNLLGNQFEFVTLEDWGLDVPGVHKHKPTEDNFDTMKPAVPVIEPGDLYELNGHRILCGDATSEEDVAKLMAGKKAALVFTDPPYNVNYEAKSKKIVSKIKNDHMEPEAFKRLLFQAFNNMKIFSEDTAPAYICYASRTHREFEDSLNAAGWLVRTQIIWVKALASFGWGDYRWKHEPILYCNRDGQSISFYGDRKQYTEWAEEPDDEELLKQARRMIKKDEDGNSTVWRFTRDSKYEHPTQKPVLLVAKAIQNSSLEDAIVLDLFTGGGTTLIAAEQLNRRAFCMELDPRFVDVTVNRWLKWMVDNNKRFEIKRNGKAYDPTR